MALELFYTFNNQDSKDYSEKGLIGTDTSITYSAGDVGYNAVFNADADRIQVSSFTALNGLTEVAFYFRAKFAATVGTQYVFYKNGQFNATFDGTTLTINIIGATGTATVTHTPTLGTYYQYHVNYVHNGIANDLSLYVDGSNVDSTTTQGALISNSNLFYLGGDGGGVVDTARFEINEFKVFSNKLSELQRTTHLANINGLICSIPRDVYELGDILVSKQIETNKGYAIVSYVGDNEIRVQPLNTYVTQSDVFTRIGHLWDTTRQYSVQVTSTGINFYNDVSLSSEAFTDAKLVYSTQLGSNTVYDSGSVGANLNNTVLLDNDIYTINPTAAIDVTGIVNPNRYRRIIIINRNTTYNITIKNQSSSSSAANRFDLVTDFTLLAGKSIEVFYDNTKSRWRIINEMDVDNIYTSTTKTANYTATNDDNIIYVDSTGGIFTITLPATPLTNKILSIIDSTGQCNTNNVTIDGNGKNIIGNTTALMNSNYLSLDLVYNGTQWNIK